MFRPQLGVSLHTLSADLTQELLQAVNGSQIATLELAAQLFDDQTHRDMVAWLKQAMGAHVRPI